MPFLNCYEQSGMSPNKISWEGKSRLICLIFLGQGMRPGKNKIKEKKN